MSTRDPDPAKRIPKSLGTDATIIGSYTLSDAAVALIPAVIVILAYQLVVPPNLVLYGEPVQNLGLPLVGVAIACGLILVAITPAYISSYAWLTRLLRYHTSQHTHPHPVATSLPQVERVYPRRKAIERADGALIAVVAVEPPSMALATDGEWERKATGFKRFLDTTVEFPLELYSTTHPFPVDDYLTHYDHRLDDPDVRANPQLKRLIEEYRAWYRQELADRQLTIRDHYVIVPVTPSEIHFEQDTPLQSLADLPVLGPLVTILFAPSPEEQRAALFETLEKRVRHVEAGLHEIEDCGVHRVAAVDAARLIADYWHGEPLEYGTLERVFRTRPLITHHQ